MRWVVEVDTSYGQWMRLKESVIRCAVPVPAVCTACVSSSMARVTRAASSSVRAVSRDSSDNDNADEDADAEEEKDADEDADAEDADAEDDAADSRRVCSHTCSADAPAATGSPRDAAQHAKANECNERQVDDDGDDADDDEEEEDESE
jgi:hypothetical protein